MGFWLLMKIMYDDLTQEVLIQKLRNETDLLNKFIDPISYQPSYMHFHC